MNQEKIGKLIKKLREEKQLTQEDLAKKVFHGREAISKWERGVTIPDTETLLILSDFFQISVNEILAGERIQKETKTIEYDDNKQQKINSKRLLISMYTFLTILITFFISYCLFNQNKTVQTYTISGHSNNFEVADGLFVKTRDKLYFSINKVKRDDMKIDKLDLYYLENDTKIPICNTESDNLLLIDCVGYEEYFDSSKIDLILDNLYLTIRYESKTETIKLDLVEDKANKRALF